MIRIILNGLERFVPPDCSVAAAILDQGETKFRHSVRGEPRGPLCGMGICFECRVTIDGIAHQRSCMIPCQPGMEIRTDE